MATILERNKKIKTPQKTRQEHAEDALYREVWEDVNNEKTMQFVKKYSNHFIIGALVILIIATGFQIGMRTYRANKLATATAYETAVQNVDANALNALAENTSGATADLALFQAYLLDNDVAKLEKLADKGDTRDFRDLAKLHIIGIRGNDMSAQDVEKYLSDLNTKNSPFYYTACLTIAQKYIADGNQDKANKWLDKIINDQDAPADIAASAQLLK